MPKRIALDYDESELRIVVANCSGSRVQVTDARVIPISEGDSVSEKLRAFINAEGHQRTETLIAIGRGKAELRELQLPPVSADELPEMVRFQAIRSFASASERAVVDFLVTKQNSENNTLIAAAVGPNDLDSVRELATTSDLLLKRVVLRPLTAASLYLRGSNPPSICVMIDLLTDDAEIVIARNGKVIFVRTVRLPSEDRHRSGAIASELRRTMVACGETAALDRIVVWGTDSVHAGDIAAIKETIECEDVRAVNPFDLVTLQMDRGALPEHVGRLAPLVGLLASDEQAADTLIDFLNPREKPEEKPDRVRQLLWIGCPIAAVLLLSFLGYRQFSNWNRKIAAATDEVNMLLPESEVATQSIERTERIDKFLDGDVNWLDEIRRLSKELPSSDKLILRGISGTVDIRAGGGTLRVVGAVKEPGIIDDLEEALRDETHTVVGKGSQEQKGQSAYPWTFTESVTVAGSDLRNIRYTRMAEQTEQDSVAAEAESAPPTDTTKDESGTDESADEDAATAKDSAEGESPESESSDDKTTNPETGDENTEAVTEVQA